MLGHCAWRCSMPLITTIAPRTASNVPLSPGGKRSTARSPAKVEADRLASWEKTVVTATDQCGFSEGASVVVTVEPGTFYIYLPVLLRQYP